MAFTITPASRKMRTKILRYSILAVDQQKSNKKSESMQENNSQFNLQDGRQESAVQRQVFGWSAKVNSAHSNWSVQRPKETPEVPLSQTFPLCGKSSADDYCPPFYNICRYHLRNHFFTSNLFNYQIKNIIPSICKRKCHNNYHKSNNSSSAS